MVAARSPILLCASLGIAALLLPGAGRAQPGPGFGAAPAPPASAPQAGWVRFTEPSEHAYTVDVPQGWTVAGGLKRYAPSEVPVWLTARSPDGATQMFIGDPALPFYVLPQQMLPEGAQMPFIHNRAATAMRYNPGAEYAAYYALRNLPALCQNLQPAGTRPMPSVEDETRQLVQTATRVDAGEADFTCQRNGQPFAAAVIAGTALATVPGTAMPGGTDFGLWGAAVLRGYLTPAPLAPQAAQVLAHMAATFQLDPQFKAAVDQAGKREADAAAASAAAAPPRPAPTPMPAPGPVVNPYPSSRPQVSHCDDLQQRRICNLNDGHLVVSDGCLKCI